MENSTLDHFLVYHAIIQRKRYSYLFFFLFFFFNSVIISQRLFMDKLFLRRPSNKDNRDHTLIFNKMVAKI